MKIIDISQEVLSCVVFPGDPAPRYNRLQTIEKDGFCNLSDLYMCAHNGTHVDAPFHFLSDGKTIDQLPLDCFVGYCYVQRVDGAVSAEIAEQILKSARAVGAAQKILISGKATVTEEAAKVFANAGVGLVGNESQTVGPESGPMAVHKILLKSGAVLLEGVVLKGVDDGKYFLSCAPLNFAGFDGAPTRAYLIKE